MIHNIIIVLNLVILESLLSIDNVAVLSLLVRHLSRDKQKKALYYGMAGAFIMRFLCLFIASWLLSVIWLKAVGGLYLIYLSMGHFTKKIETAEENKDANDSGLYNFMFYKLGISMFASTIILVEFMDLVFSVDNVFAAVAMSNTYWVVMTGVGIGILSMRLIATWFLGIMRKYPSLEVSAFIVIGLLGLKLVLSCLSHYLGWGQMEEIMKGHWFEFLFSGCMMVIFFIPVIRRRAYPAL